MESSVPRKAIQWSQLAIIMTNNWIKLVANVPEVDEQWIILVTWLKSHKNDCIVHLLHLFSKRDGFACMALGE
jgi:hypothetical protein